MSDARTSVRGIRLTIPVGDEYDPACEVCHLPLGDENGHDYHDPQCSLIRGAVMACEGGRHQDNLIDCDCAGLVHDGCCSVCTVDKVLAPVLAVLEHREERWGG